MITLLIFQVILAVACVLIMLIQRKLQQNQKKLLENDREIFRRMGGGE